jgi:hypothetical protein
MNGKKAKAIRKAAKQKMLTWMKTLVSVEEAEGITEHNMMLLQPRETHLYKERTLLLMPQSYKKFIKEEKKLWKMK